MKKLMVGLVLSVVAFGSQAAVRTLTPTNTTADIQAAIDAVSAAGGGEVRFEKGVYRLTAALVPKTGVTLVGAPDGESVLSGMYGGAAYGFGNNNVRPATRTYSFTETEFTVPPKDDETTFGYGPVQWPNSSTFSNLIVDPGTEPLGAFGLRDLVFTASSGVAVILKAGSDVTVSNCVFRGCGTFGAGCTISTAGWFLIVDTTFLCTACAVSHESGDLTYTNRILRTKFLDSPSGALVEGSTAKTALEFAQCTFARNFCTARGSNSKNGAVITHFQAPNALTFTDCLFDDNRCGAVSGNGCFALITASGGKMLIDRCEFKRNGTIHENMTESAATTHATCFSIGSCGLVLRDSIFHDNFCRGSCQRKKAEIWTSVGLVGSGCNPLVMNCSFYNNSVTKTDVTDDYQLYNYIGTFYVGRYGNGSDNNTGFLMVNSVFSDNLFTTTSTNAADVVMDHNYNDRGGFSAAFVNTTIWNAADDFKPFHGYEIRPSVAHCAMKNLDLSVFRNSGAYSNDLNTTTNPQVTIGKVRVDGTRYTTALLKRGTPFADKGVLILEKNNVCYFYDTDAAKWRNARLKTTVTPATVAGATPIVDFVGDPQVEGRVPYAPYYLNPTGLKLLVR